MLDVNQIAGQINHASRDAVRRRQELADHVAEAARIARWDGKDFSVEQRRLLNARTSWLVAHPLTASPATTYPAAASPEAYSVVAADGSQIVPDRHDGAGGVYLLNVGRVRLTYPAPDTPLVRPRLDSLSEVLMLDEDDDETERQATAGIAPRRFAREMQALGFLTEEATRIGLPALALTDGSLIAWHLSNERNTSDERDAVPASPAQEEAFAALLTTLDAAHRQRIPLVGYISGPGSRDVVNALRIGMDVTKTAIRTDATATSPSDAIRLATDSALFAKLLRPGERSEVFTALGQEMGFSRILKRYPAAQWIAFFYLNTGVEIARVEIPQWVAEDATLLDLVHGVCLDQAQKGRGYPVALAEAHEQAVVSGADRDLFFRMLHRAMARQGATVTPTRKAMAKQARGL